MSPEQQTKRAISFYQGAIMGVAKKTRKFAAVSCQGNFLSISTHI